jgi:hypothetical protein
VSVKELALKWANRKFATNTRVHYVPPHSLKQMKQEVLRNE